MPLHCGGQRSNPLRSTRKSAQIDVISYGTGYHDISVACRAKDRFSERSDDSQGNSWRVLPKVWRTSTLDPVSPALLTLWSRRGSSISTSRTCVRSWARWERHDRRRRSDGGTPRASRRGRGDRQSAVRRCLIERSPGCSAVSITGDGGLALYEVDEAANRIREEVDEEANIIVGAIIEPALEQAMRVSVVATGIGNWPTDRMEQMSARSLAGPVLSPNLAPPSLDQTARTAFSIVESHPPIAAGPEFETAPHPSPIIPFPEPTGRRRIERRGALQSASNFRRLLE